MSGGGGSESKTTSSTKVELPQWYENYAKDIAAQGYAQSQVPYQQYTKQRIADPTWQQTAGLNYVAALGANNPLSRDASSLAQKTLAGQYLDPATNPAWTQGVKDIGTAYNDILQPNTNTMFSRSNALGFDNSAYNQYQGQQQRQLGDSISGLWGDLYNQERGRQTTTLGLTPSINQNRYTDYTNLIGAGDALRSNNQALLDQNYGDFLTKQQYPWTQMGNFASLVPGLLGNSGSTMSQGTGPNPNQTSPIAGAAGGAALGAGLASAIPAVAATGYGLPIAAILGAIAGGALS